MAFFQLRSPAGNVWPPLPAADVSQVWAAYQELDRTQWLSPAELEDKQLQQLRVLLQHCVQQIPYYRRILTEAGLAARPIESLAELRRLPLLTRELYQAHFADLQARSLPAGMTGTSGGYTSGTNGVPIKVMKTNRDNMWWGAFFLRDLEWCGLDPRGRLAAVRLMAMTREDLPRTLQGMSFPYWSQFCQNLLEMSPAFGMDIRQDPRRQLAWLRQVNPDYLISLASNLEFLAGLVQESGQPLPRLRIIQAVGESLSETARQRIEAGFGVPVKNLYSTTESGYMASPCPLGHGLHVHAENVVVEVLDADNRPCLPGQTGRLVFTTLHNFMAPFLRYDILDDVTLAPAPCPCGRGLPLWTHVEGRRHPLLHLPDGRRKSVMGITLGVRKVGGCHQFQIIQRAVDHVILRVVPDRTWNPDHAARMRLAVQEEFEAPIRVDVEEKEFMERPPGGKLKIAIVELEQASSPHASVPKRAGEHWPVMARQWSLIGPPLRPSAQDVAFCTAEMQRWVAVRGVPRAMILGVTPELYHIPWPNGTSLLAVDRTQNMIDTIWPGPSSTAICADWIEMPVKNGSRDLVLCDGGNLLFSFPDEFGKLVRTMQRVLAPGGLCMFRLFVPPAQRETPEAVLHDLLEARVANLNILKLRLAMALQEDSTQGVPLGRVWDELHKTAPDLTVLAAKIGWPPENLLAINTYRDCASRYYFHSVAEVRQLFTENPGGFTLEGVNVPDYELGDRCPTVVFRRGEAVGQ
jgi:phenylacetate-CoA ligase